MLTILVITGGLLDGAGKGIEFYIGSADVSKFYEPGVWKDAVKLISYFVLQQYINGILNLDCTNILRFIGLPRWLNCNE